MDQINTEASWNDKRSFTMIYHIYRWIVYLYISTYYISHNHSFYKFQITFFNKFSIIYSVSFSFNWRNNVILQYSLSFSVIIYTASHVFIFKYFQYLVHFTCILKVVTWFKRLYNINHKLFFSAHVFKIIIYICSNQAPYNQNWNYRIFFLPLKCNIMHLFLLYLCPYELNLSETLSANSKMPDLIFYPQQATWLKLLPMQWQMQAMWKPMSTIVTLQIILISLVSF